MTINEFRNMTDEEKKEYFGNIDKTEQDIIPFPSSLAETELWDNEEMANILKRFCDGEEVNDNPLKEFPIAEMKLYTVCGVFQGDYLDTEEEFLEYLKNNKTNSNDIGTVEYLRNCAGRSDVIKFTSYDTGDVRLFASFYGDSYGVYNFDRSTYRGEFVWEYNHGSLREIYKAFRDRGVVFENDLYAQIDERNKMLYKYLND